jgi:hypothetical protein
MGRGKSKICRNFERLRADLFKLLFKDLKFWMKQKKHSNIILFGLILILAGVLGYLALVKKPTPPTPPSQAPSPNIPPQQPPPAASPEAKSKPIDWKSLIPTIREILGPTFLGVRVELNTPMSIFQENDITGDGVPEALVDLGTGGAYTSFLTLMRIENGKPVVAEFKQKDGKISPLIFPQGASVMNGESVVMLQERNAIYAGHWSKSVTGIPFGSLTDCDVEAYRWNSDTKTFDFDLNLSNEIRQEFCQKVERGE